MGFRAVNSMQKPENRNRDQLKFSSLRRAKNIIVSASSVESSAFRKVAREILEKTGWHVSHVTVHREDYRQGLKPFHVIAKSLKTNMLVEVRR